jgi:hypothetical protein
LVTIRWTTAAARAIVVSSPRLLWRRSRAIFTRLDPGTKTRERTFELLNFELIALNGFPEKLLEPLEPEGVFKTDE